MSVARRFGAGTACRHGRVPGVWRVRVRGTACRSSVSLLVIALDVAVGSWPACADVVLCGEHRTVSAAADAICRAVARFPGAAVALAWHRDTAVFGRAVRRGVAAGSSLVVVGEFIGSRIPEPGVQAPGFLPVLVRVLEVAVAGFQLGERRENLGRVVRRIELADHVQRAE